MDIKNFETTKNVENDDMKTENNEADLAKKNPNDDIKNAHATGDGSYGRNDESLPEEEAGTKTETSY